MAQPERADGRVRRTLILSADVDKALGFVAVEKKIERGVLAEAALRLYLPTLSNMAPVQAISQTPVAS